MSDEMKSDTVGSFEIRSAPGPVAMCHTYCARLLGKSAKHIHTGIEGRITAVYFGNENSTIQLRIEYWDNNRLVTERYFPATELDIHFEA